MKKTILIGTALAMVLKIFCDYISKLYQGKNTILEEISREDTT